MQALNNLLAQLDASYDLLLLPCYCDDISQITFRLGGRDSGPMIHFLRVNDENYDLVIRNIEGDMRNFPIQKSSQYFVICSRINMEIRTVVENVTYKSSLSNEFSMAAFIGNLERLIQPIFR